MEMHIRMQLEYKIVKIIRQLGSYTELADYKCGLTYGELTHRMWYFIRKHKIEDKDIFKVLRRLEAQGHITLTVENRQLQILAPKLATLRAIREGSTEIHDEEMTEEELEASEREARVKNRPTPEIEREIIANAYRFAEKSRVEKQSVESVKKFYERENTPVKQPEKSPGEALKEKLEKYKPKDPPPNTVEGFK